MNGNTIGIVALLVVAGLALALNAPLIYRRHREHLMNQPQISGETSYHYYYQFIERLKEIVGSDMFFDLFYCDQDGDHLTPERICQAAYLAVDEEFV